MDAKNIFYEFFPNERIFHSKKKRLIVLLGSFGDFDSFEYCQCIKNNLSTINKLGVKVIFFGIGTNQALKSFSSYTELPSNLIYSLPDDSIHKELNLCSGSNLPIGIMANLLLMCAGINSPGTLKEIIRGYTGDRKAKNIFNKNQLINIGIIKNINTDIFKLNPFDDGTVLQIPPTQNIPSLFLPYPISNLFAPFINPAVIFK